MTHKTTKSIPMSDVFRINVPKGIKGIIKREYPDGNVLFETIYGTFPIRKEDLQKIV